MSETAALAGKWKNRIVRESEEDPAQLLANPANFRIHPKHQREALRAVLDAIGWVQRVIVNEETQHVIDGHLRIEEAMERGEPVPVLWVNLSLDEERAILSALDPIAGLAVTDQAKLTELRHEMNGTFPLLRQQLEASRMWPASMKGIGGAKSLAERFVVPPLTIWDKRAGYWQDRRRSWLELGIKSEEGRSSGEEGQQIVPGGGGPTSLYQRATERLVQGTENATSVFDPVICELAYRWFCPAGGQVIDPFAGGSVRGIVAGMLGRAYWGCDLRAEQVAANLKQAEELSAKLRALPEWTQGDSRLKMCEAPEADFLFSCPPYGDLEVYSEHPADLSNMEWKAFEEAYREIVFEALRRLKADRFACFVVGDIRDKHGILRDLPGLTVRAFEEAGAAFYNDAIIAAPVLSAAQRAGRTFVASKKLTRVHQVALIFCKGSTKRAAEACEAESPASEFVGALEVAEEAQ